MPEARQKFEPGPQVALAATLLQIEAMRRDVQTGVLDAMMTASQQFLDQQIKQSDFMVANEIVRVLRDGLLLAADIATQLKLSNDLISIDKGPKS